LSATAFANYSRISSKDSKTATTCSVGTGICAGIATKSATNTCAAASTAVSASYGWFLTAKIIRPSALSTNEVFYETATSSSTTAAT
jgi:hypothetical protein